MAGIDLAGVRKIYPGGFEAIKDVDLEIADGEFVVLVGPSGCGKSTLLRMIAGLERITDGTIAISDRVVNTLEPMDRDIAMVFQNYALYPHMSVYQNLAYGLKNRGTPKDEIDRRVAEVARILEIAPFLDRKPRQLSGGQRQRVAMGRAIVRQPAAFLFDEPLSNLDAKLRTQLRGELRALHRRLGATFVFVTHDQVEAMSMADRIVILNAGDIEQVGTPAEVYERPQTRFVAEFIGNPSINILPGVLDGTGRQVNVEGGLNVALRDAATAPPDAQVLVGLRPEDLEIVQSGQPALNLEVADIEQLGADTVLHGRLTLGGAPLCVRLTKTRRIEPGEIIPLRFASEHLHLFDRETGRRLG